MRKNFVGWAQTDSGHIWVTHCTTIPIFHTWNIGIVLIFPNSDISWNTGLETGFLCQCYLNGGRNPVRVPGTLNRTASTTHIFFQLGKCVREWQKVKKPGKIDRQTKQEKEICSCLWAFCGSHCCLSDSSLLCGAYRPPEVLLFWNDSTLNFLKLIPFVLHSFRDV